MTIRLWVYNHKADAIEFQVDGQATLSYAPPRTCAQGLELIASVLRGNRDVTRSEIEQLTEVLLRFTPTDR